MLGHCVLYLSHAKEIQELMPIQTIADLLASLECDLSLVQTVPKLLPLDHNCTAAYRCNTGTAGITLGIQDPCICNWPLTSDRYLAWCHSALYEDMDERNVLFTVLGHFGMTFCTSSLVLSIKRPACCQADYSAVRSISQFFFRKLLTALLQLNVNQRLVCLY